MQSCKIQLCKHAVGVLGKKHQINSERLSDPFKATKLIIGGKSQNRSVCSVGDSHEGVSL